MAIGLPGSPIWIAGVGAKTAYIMGDRFTVCDINVAEVIRYALPAKELWTAAPKVSAWLKSCQSRPAYQEMMAKRNAEPE